MRIRYCDRRQSAPYTGPIGGRVRIARRGAAVARVVCRVVRRPGRMSILWSEAGASFEPLHIEGADLAAFETSARQARERWAEVVAGRAAESDLTLFSHDLYRRFFAGPVGHEIINWLHGLESRGELESVE